MRKTRKAKIKNNFDRYPPACSSLWTGGYFLAKTNENKFWTDEEAEVIHSEKEVYEEEKQAVIDTKYRAIHNDIEESDTWSMDEEVDVNSTIDLLESN